MCHASSNFSPWIRWWCKLVKIPTQMNTVNMATKILSTKAVTIFSKILLVLCQKWVVAYLECRWYNKVDGRCLDDRIVRTRSCGGERRRRGIHLQPHIPLISFILLFYYDWLKSNNYLLFRVLHQPGLAASLCSICTVCVITKLWV